MSEHDDDSFEDRLRAMAEQINESVQRLSEVDFDEVAERYGVDAERARGLADAAGQWLSERLSAGGVGGAGFGSGPARDPDSAARPSGEPTPPLSKSAGPGPNMPGAHPPGPHPPGPHPLDLPTERQGVALSALDSGRWTVRSGSHQLAGTGEGPPPPDGSDVVGELRARDWITVDGALTLVGRQALARWSRTAEPEAGGPAPAGDASSTPR